MKDRKWTVLIPLSVFYLLKINADCILPLARKAAATALLLIQPAVILPSADSM